MYQNNVKNRSLITIQLMLTVIRVYCLIFLFIYEMKPGKIKVNYEGMTSSRHFDGHQGARTPILSGPGMGDFSGNSMKQLYSIWQDTSRHHGFVHLLPETIWNQRIQLWVNRLMNDDWLMGYFSAILMEEYDGILDDERFHENRTSGLRNYPELSNSGKKRCEIDIDALDLPGT